MVAIDRQKLAAPTPLSDRSWTAHFRKTGSQWTVADSAVAAGLHKVHGLQVVDDAFLDSFVFVTPTGAPMVPGLASWVAGEQKHAIAEWRRQFRGEAQVREDGAVTDADIAASNLVLWGDPGSNSCWRASPISCRCTGRPMDSRSAAGTIPPPTCPSWCIPIR